MATKNPEIHTDEIALFSRPPVNVAEDRISWHEVRPSYMSNADYLCGLVELAGKVVNLKGDLFLCCDFCEESVVGNIKLPVLRCIKRKQTGIVYNDINHMILLQVIRPNINSIRLYIVNEKGEINTVEKSKLKCTLVLTPPKNEC